MCTDCTDDVPRLRLLRQSSQPVQHMAYYLTMWSGGDLSLCNSSSSDRTKGSVRMTTGSCQWPLQADTILLTPQMIPLTETGPSSSSMTGGDVKVQLDMVKADLLEAQKTKYGMASCKGTPSGRRPKRSYAVAVAISTKLVEAERPGDSRR